MQFRLSCREAAREVARLQRALQSVRAWPSTSERRQAGLQHVVWGFCEASNADRAALADVLLGLEASRLQVCSVPEALRHLYPAEWSC